jgi:TonB family protein
MDIGSGLSQPAARSSSAALPGPRFLVQLEPPHRVFLSNLLDILLFRQAQKVPAPPSAPFWPDVFVPNRLPWLGFVESVLYHALAVVGIWTFSQFWVLRPQLQPPPTFSRSNVIYYTPSEYLPPLDTGSAPAAKPQKGNPVYARQEIISVPAEPDNHTQTIVTPPNIQLDHDVPVPNIVAWNEATPAVPLAATERTRMEAPSVRPTVAAPPPVVENAGLRRADAGPAEVAEVIAPPPDVAALQAPRALGPAGSSVIPPPPMVQGATRVWGDLNVGKSAVVAPAPELPLGEQRALAGVLQSNAGNTNPQVVPPPPSVQNGSPIGRRSVAGSRAGAGFGAPVVPPPPSSHGVGAAFGGRIIALGIHPAAAPPPPDLAGNRRGAFAATPQGKAGAPGTPDIAAGPQSEGRGGHGHGNGGAGAGSDITGGAPPGIHVGPGARPFSTTSGLAGDPAGDGAGSLAGAKGDAKDGTTLVADNRPMRVTVTPNRVPPSAPPTEVERRVFGDRRSYSMILNMPNLNSAGGSWIIRFAELKQSEEKGDLSAPEATHKVDPGYPIELMRQNVRGMVTLYAVIHSDGSVGEVRVLSSPDERLDRYAQSALARWRFRPALKDGKPVDLEAVVSIPFHPTRF